MKNYKRYNFSLTEDVSKNIDRLSLLSRNFRSNRSDVIKASIKAFMELSETEQLKYLKSVCYKEQNS